jgi:hypothetical protein
MAVNRGFGSFRHLAIRFFGALDPRGPSLSEEQWALGSLLPGEASLWRRMSGPDRRHAAGVARETDRLLDGAASRPVVAAALLHDVGKVASGLGTFSRVAVTVAAIVLGRERLVSGGRRASGVRRRVAQYLEHDRLGADLCSAAGSDQLTVAWAREHHQPPSAWTVPEVVARALKEADGD